MSDVNGVTLGKALKMLDMDMITPHKVNRVLVKMQDGRAMLSLRKRWKIERCLAWPQTGQLQDYHAHNFHPVVLPRLHSHTDAKLVWR